MSAPKSQAHVPELSSHVAAELIRLSRVCADFNHAEFAMERDFADVSPRKHLAIGALFLTHEHHNAVVSLYDAGLSGAALAMLRPCFEALARGLWLVRGRDEQQLARFMAGHDTLQVEQLLKQIRKWPGGERGAFLQTSWAESERFLHQFTHVSYQLLVRRTPWESHPAADGVSEAARAQAFAAGAALLATIELARLVGSVDLVRRASNLLQAIYPAPRRRPLNEAGVTPSQHSHHMNGRVL